MKFFDFNKVLQKGRRLKSGLTSLTEEAIADPKRLLDALKEMKDRILALESQASPEATEFEVDVGINGSVTILNHGFNSPVRWTVTSWKASSGRPGPQYNTPERPLWSARGALANTLTNAAGNFTTATLWRLKQYREIVGIRFGYQNNSTTQYNVRCVLWNASTGAVQAEKTVSVQSRGIYEAIFDSPVTQDLTGVNITTSVYDLSGTRNWADTVSTGDGIEFPSMTLISRGLFIAGNNRPTAGTSNDNPIEPILGNYVTGPQLVTDPSSDTNNLRLKSWAAGRAVIRVEPSQYTVS